VLVQRLAGVAAAAGGADHAQVIELGGHKAGREHEARQGCWLPALRARRALHEPGAETLAAEHLSAFRFDHRVHQRLLANRTHEVAVDVVVLIHEYLRAKAWLRRKPAKAVKNSQTQRQEDEEAL
jgi:hypothetical protein